MEKIEKTTDELRHCYMGVLKYSLVLQNYKITFLQLVPTARYHIGKISTRSVKFFISWRKIDWIFSLSWGKRCQSIVQVPISRQNLFNTIRIGMGRSGAISLPENHEKNLQSRKNTSPASFPHWRARTSCQTYISEMWGLNRFKIDIETLQSA